MNRLSRENQLQEVRQRLDIVDVVAEYVVLRKQGLRLVGLCPFHHEKTPSFTVSGDKQLYYCFGCQAGGDVFDFLMRKENLTFPEALERLAEKAGVDLSLPEDTPEAKRRQAEEEKYYKLNSLAQDFFHRQLLQEKRGQEALQYLTRRKISLKTIQTFGLGFAPDTWDALTGYLRSQGFGDEDMERAGLASRGPSGTIYDRFRKRVMFPIRNHRGKIVGFGGRVLDDSIPKYLNTPETPIFHKGQVLFGLYQAAGAIRERGSSTIMEGYMDVITAHQLGVSHAVASLGTAFTREQGKLLMRYTNQVVIAYDADAAGSKATLRGLDLLTDLGFRVKVLTLPDGKDPDEFLHRHGLEAFQAEESLARNLMEYKLAVAMGEEDTSTVVGRTNVVGRLLPDLARVTNAVEQEGYVQLMSKTLRLSENAIVAELRKYTRKTQKNEQNGHSKEKLRNTNLDHPLENSKPGAFINRGKTGNRFYEAQRTLLRFILDDAGLWPRIEREVGMEALDEPAVAAIIQVLREQGSVDGSRLMEKLSDGQLRAWVSRLLLEEMPEQEEREKVLHDCLEVIRLNRLEKQRLAIQREIAELERQGNLEELREKLRLLQQMEISRSKVRTPYYGR